MRVGIEVGPQVSEEEGVEPKEMRCVPLPLALPVYEMQMQMQVVEKVKSDKDVNDDEAKSDGKLCRGNFPVTTPRYLTLEPSLAMDWLEIAWDELHIKERIGAGN